MTTRQRSREQPRPLAVDPGEAESLRHGLHANPHHVLGAHSVPSEQGRGVVVRAFHPDATGAECLLGADQAEQMTPLGGGLFAAHLPEEGLPLRYRLRFRFPDGAAWERDDPYRFLPGIGDLDLHLFNEGTHRRLWQVLGAHPCDRDGVRGTRFAVWAPNARGVSVVGDFCRWDGRLFPMRVLGSSGIFELFVPGVGAGDLRLKTDPFAAAMELPPHQASRVVRSAYVWGDHAWQEGREKRDPSREPLSIYEVHLGSWARILEESQRSPTYRELAPRLVEHVKRLGFTHVELLPVMEHAFYGSWGYQVTGYFAPTARYGAPDDLRYFVDHCHQNGIGVLLDWVPAHFPKDDFSLRRFDGTALFEHEDPRRGEHPDWGTLIFNYGRPEVRNFLVANALYWLEEFHADGLRVDAVASMLYLDYSRREGEWLPNPLGGRENLDAIDFLRLMNDTVHGEVPGALTIAEESTAWAGVTKPTAEGGLGFSFKWNMGWMHDTLVYFAKEPVHRRHHQDQLTFAMIYEYSERFINPLSHDEVVHGKGSLLGKMPGDTWQKLANLRALLTYQYTRPGKNLLFMGTELAPDREWNHDASLDWHLVSDPPRQAFGRFVEELGRLYLETPALWRRDPDPEGFTWIDASDRDQSIISYVRRDEDSEVLVVLNLTPVPRAGYRVGAPRPGRWIRRFSSDDRRFGGSEFETLAEAATEPVPLHGQQQSLQLHLPPLGALVLIPG
jgi:1,4-alpha-glucan branching enzyme